MGNILSTLQTTGSQYTYYDGNNPQINPLATKDSDLHYDSKKYQGGYSTRGSDISNYPQFFQNYNLPANVIAFCFVKNTPPSVEKTSTTST